MALTYRKAKKVLGFQEGKPTVYKICQLIYTQMKFDQLVNECSIACGVNASQTRAVIDALINRMVAFMQVGHSIRLGDFGSFKPVFNAKCVKTAEEATADTVTIKKIQFRPGKAFRTMLNDLEVQSASKTLDVE